VGKTKTCNKEGIYDRYQVDGEAITGQSEGSEGDGLSRGKAGLDQQEDREEGGHVGANDGKGGDGVEAGRGG
jgi:hypothetical protein